MSSLSQTLAPPPSRSFRLLRGSFDAAFLRCLVAAALNTGGSQVIRLAGNLALTRLLFPEAFGLMAIVSVFLIGLEMFSDIGVGASVVQRKAEPSLRFIQTAWTLQAIRGVALWMIACLLAWPVAGFYSEPDLRLLLPAAAFSLVLAGFKSTAIHLCSRRLRHGSLTLVDLSSALAGVLVAIVLAAQFRSIWALVIGGLFAAAANLAATWYLPGQVPHRLRWHRPSVHEMIRFGRWIFVGTIFTFVAANGDRLLLGRFLSMEELGIYTVAFFFAQSVGFFMAGMGTRVLFPVLSRSTDAGALRRYRRLLLVGALVPLAVFIVGGPWLIEFLYDERYRAAESMLQILSLGSAAAVLRVLSEPVLLARGDSKSRMVLGICEATILLGALAIGGGLFGLPGFLVGYVAGQVLTLVPTALLMGRAGCLSLRDDATYLLAVAVLAAAGWLIHAPDLGAR